MRLKEEEVFLDWYKTILKYRIRNLKHAYKPVLSVFGYWLPFRNKHIPNSAPWPVYRPLKGYYLPPDLQNFTKTIRA